MGVYTSRHTNIQITDGMICRIPDDESVYRYRGSTPRDSIKQFLNRGQYTMTQLSASDVVPDQHHCFSQRWVGGKEKGQGLNSVVADDRSV